jgi:hypothetical protein
MATGVASAQTYTEGFESVDALPAAGWLQVNTGAPPRNPWFQGNSGIFPAFAGPLDSYAGADFLSSASGVIDNWLISPELSIQPASVLSFATRSAGTQGFADVLEVLFSTGGGSALGAFMSLGTIGLASAYPAGWTVFSLALPDVASGRFAFRQLGTADTADYLGIDSVQVTLAVPIPEPETWALMGAGLAALTFIGRRRKAGKRSST